MRKREYMPTHTQAIDWTPTKNRLRVLRCTSAEVEEAEDGRYYWEGNVCVPEWVGDRSNQVIVLDAGPDCRMLRQADVRAAAERGEHIRLWIREAAIGLHRISGEEFVIREDADGVIPLALMEIDNA